MSTRWSPDSCDCILEIAVDVRGEWATCSRIVHACAAHNGLDENDIYRQVYEAENKHKSEVMAAALAALPDDATRAAAIIDFRFDENRTLELSFDNVTGAQHAAMTTAARIRDTAATVRAHGAGRVARHVRTVFADKSGGVVRRS